VFSPFYTRLDLTKDKAFKFLHFFLCNQSNGRPQSFVVFLQYSKHSVAVELDAAHQSQCQEKEGDTDSVTCGKGIILLSINRRPAKEVSTTQHERSPKCEARGYADFSSALQIVFENLN
jgi:hypothetical protein